VQAATPESEDENMSQETEVTMNCKGSLEERSEIRGICSCEGIPSVQTDKSKCAYQSTKKKKQ